MANSKYQMARGKVAEIAENFGYYSSKTGSQEAAVKSALENLTLRHYAKEDVLRIARMLKYPVRRELGKWIIKTTGEEL